MTNKLIPWIGADLATQRLIKAAQGIAILKGRTVGRENYVAMCKAVRLFIEAGEEEVAREIMDEIAALEWETPQPPLILEAKMKAVRASLTVPQRRVSQ